VGEKTAKGKFTSVEMSVLGLTWLRGPCTTYTVMKQLSLSESTFHRSRAGTAYTTMNRLMRLGLVEKLDDDNVQVTEKGVAALREWTGPEVPMMDVAHSADLLRLRFFFLEVLSPADRLEFVDRSIASLREFESRCVGLLPKNQEIGEYFGALATACSILEVRARIKWLETVRSLVEQPLPPDADWTTAILARIKY